MPRIPFPQKKLRSGGQRTSMPDRLPLRKLASELEDLRGALWSIHSRLSSLQGELYRRGLDATGPIVETKDDVPF